MLRRTGFKRVPPSVRISDPDRLRAMPMPTAAFRMAVSAGDMGIPIAKPEAHRNAHLLSMARGRPCLFRIPGVCCFDDSTSVACHSNLLIHGKAKSRKADDCYVVTGCFTCHAWLDQGPADGTTKELAFMAAHLAQVCEWRAIAGSSAADPKDRLAAQWALDHLNASPVVEHP